LRPFFIHKNNFVKTAIDEIEKNLFLCFYVPMQSVQYLATKYSDFKSRIEEVAFRCICFSKWW